MNSGGGGNAKDLTLLDCGGSDKDISGSTHTHYAAMDAPLKSPMFLPNRIFISACILLKLHAVYLPFSFDSIPASPPTQRSVPKSEICHNPGFFTERTFGPLFPLSSDVTTAMNSEDLNKLSHDFEAESELKEVMELDRKSRNASGIMNRIHSTLELQRLTDSSSSITKSCYEEFAKIASVVPPNQFWRYITTNTYPLALAHAVSRWKDMWTRSLQNIIFVTALNEYLTTERLLTLPECEQLLGVDPEWKGRFQIPSEDYLHGIIALVNELLNLKNDSLRRRFDSLKYDMKKIEEVWNIARKF
ncbi:Translin domain-containing protein [Rhizoctonia solani AG-1 IA]|uniref:Translin domain-containing protein n=1 Tax=Thanatephorus cucumeris (strain AG1-IA) TaxID=983506 RepID=L8X5P3_THACA|nr:Translin domain-containing protein [Rhizoctonia solani AG-1 IA]